MKYIYSICFIMVAVCYVAMAEEEECADEEYCSDYKDIYCSAEHIQVECCKKCKALAEQNPDCPYGEEDWCSEFKDQCGDEDMKKRCCLTCQGKK